MTDSRLLQGFCAGENDACDTVGKWARGAIRHRIPGIQPDDEHDITQQTILKIWLYVTKPDFELRSSFHALVTRIALARCIDFIRAREFHKEINDLIPGDEENAEADLFYRERLWRLHNAISMLRPLCRKLIRLRFVEEKPFKMIAADMDRNSNTLRVHLHNCLENLRSVVKSCDNDNE